jgi:hypothetical protein
MVGLDLRVHTNTLAGYCIPTETDRHARLEKRERLLDTFVSCLVIGVLFCNE